MSKKKKYYETYETVILVIIFITWLLVWMFFLVTEKKQYIHTLVEDKWLTSQYWVQGKVTQFENMIFKHFIVIITKNISTVSIGPCHNIKTVFPGMVISFIKIRLSWDCLTFIMANPYTGKKISQHLTMLGHHLAQWGQKIRNNFTKNFFNHHMPLVVQII